MCRDRLRTAQWDRRKRGRVLKIEPRHWAAAAAILAFRLHLSIADLNGMFHDACSLM